MKRIAVFKLFLVIIPCFLMTACRIIEVNSSDITFRLRNNVVSIWSWSALVAVGVLFFTLIWLGWISFAPAKTIRVKIIKKRKVNFEMVQRENTTYAYTKSVVTHCTIDVVKEGGTIVHTWRCNADQMKGLTEGRFYTLKVKSGTILRVVSQKKRHPH